MSRLRKIANNLKGQPKLKKVLAEWLTNYEMSKNNYDIKKMLLNGHRGFLAMHEKELTDLFDKKYAELKKYRDNYLEDLKEDGLEKWRVGQIKDMIIKIEARLKNADKVYDEIFEGVFL